MPEQGALLKQLTASGAVPGPGGTVAHWGDPACEYRSLEAPAGLVFRAERRLLEVTGSDRSAWLHNLTTNQIRTLEAGQGVYAFALNVQGRILFDLNVLALPDSLWLDIDQRFLEAATKHLSKYILTEDVEVSDRSQDYSRIALAGPATSVVLSDLGQPHFAAMPALAHAEMMVNDTSVRFMRHDWCGPVGAELFVPSQAAVACWDHLWARYPDLLRGVGEQAVQIRRIEGGMVWPGFEITSDVLPAETQQLDRAVSFVKGCYLGQEVVERMRSRHVVARLLVGLKLEGNEVPAQGANILDSTGAQVGQVTSACRSIARCVPIALGYVRRQSAEAGTRLQVAWNGSTSSALVVALPFVAPAPSG